MPQPLKHYPLTHAGIQPIHHPDLGVEVNAQTAVKYLRFLRLARLERLELPYSVYGRWSPMVPTHPAHLVISTLDPKTFRWQTLSEVELPLDERICGEGLSQQMDLQAMDSHFAKVLQSPPRMIELGGVVSDHLRVECDREHSTWANHGECNGGPYNVPFGILDPLVAYGDFIDTPQQPAAYQPLLRQGSLRPQAPTGMRCSQELGRLTYSSPHLEVSFSLRRPLLMHLGWDILGNGRSAINRLGLRQFNFLHPPGLVGGLSGPLYRGLDGEYGAQLWTGEVEVQDNRVSYRRLTCGVPGLELDAVFTIESDRLLLELIQNCDRPIPALEWEAWRFLWDLRQGMTGAAAQPTLLPGRNGDVQLPMLWASDGGGCLSVRLLEGESRMQVESYRAAYCTTGGAVLAPHPGAETCLVIPSGTRRALFELALTNLLPDTGNDQANAETSFPPVFQRHWATAYTCFRPEYGGFSNHAAAVNCHVNQHGPLEIAVNTRPHSSGFQPFELMRFTIERALLDGGGYGYWRNLYLDADPSLVCAAGRIFQVEGDTVWLKRIEPGLRAAVTRMVGTIGEEGLSICRDLSGNSASFRWSTNAMDVVGFGHIDAYVNAWSYRALRNAGGMFHALGDHTLANRCRELAQGIRAVYAQQLLNPETGWVAGWRSRDGQLHDYAFLWVNGPAIAFGLLDEAQAKQALNGLESLRQKVGPPGAEFGIPHNLLPIRADDHMLPQIIGDLQPTFERYTDGALGAYTLVYYIRALSIYGFKDSARRLADEFSAGLLADTVVGGMESGVEFHTWEGLPSGYEGTFGPNFAPLYAMAIEYGLIQPRQPEWWLPEG